MEWLAIAFGLLLIRGMVMFYQNPTAALSIAGGNRGEGQPFDFPKPHVLDNTSHGPNDASLCVENEDAPRSPPPPEMADEIAFYGAGVTLPVFQDDFVFAGMGQSAEQVQADPHPVAPEQAPQNEDKIEMFHQDFKKEQSQRTAEFIGPPKPPVALSDWIAEGIGVEILKYEPHRESLFLVWDDSSAEAVEPEISVVVDFLDPDITHVFMNGIAVAEVSGDPDLAATDVALMPLSAAEILGLTPV